MCRATLDDAHDRPAPKPRKPRERIFRPDEMPWRDQADLLRTMLKSVSRRHDVPPEAIMGRDRKRYISIARIDLYRRLHKILGSIRAVADLVGRDHSTVNFYCRGFRKDTQRVLPPAMFLHKRGMGIWEIADATDASADAVWKMLKRAGVTLPYPSRRPTTKDPLYAVHRT
jgi:hypothetical protein